MLTRVFPSQILRNALRTIVLGRAREGPVASEPSHQLILHAYLEAILDLERGFACLLTVWNHGLWVGELFLTYSRA